MLDDSTHYLHPCLQEPIFTLKFKIIVLNLNLAPTYYIQLALDHRFSLLGQITYR